MKFDCAIAGGGIVGLATAMILNKRQPGLKIVVLEKEPEVALHQTGRNSGVIHSGIYYKPGSFKAKFAREGNQSMRTFCDEQGIPYDVCGKLIVATRESHLPGLDALYQRGLQNGLDVSQVSAETAREIEPNVACIRAIQVKSTGIVNYRQVSLKYVELFQKNGGTVKNDARLERVARNNGNYTLETTAGAVETRFFINCGGLHSDRIAGLAGEHAAAKIVPFRGEYYELVPEKRHLVKTLIYPVPNPQFPFLGVHFTRMIDGSVHAGPNAVLAFSREGYNKTDFNWPDFRETLGYSGFWRLARRHLRDGCMEIYRSVRKQAFVRSLQELVPAVNEKDLVPSEAGVRAQALAPDGRLVDDFLIVNGPGSIHVFNAPSPAATASLEIGAEIASRYESAKK
jgi:L-2-hydroxyglutarate oxidase